MIPEGNPGNVLAPYAVANSLVPGCRDKQHQTQTWLGSLVLAHVFSPHLLHAGLFVIAAWPLQVFMP